MAQNIIWDYGAMAAHPPADGRKDTLSQEFIRACQQSLRAMSDEGLCLVLRKITFWVVSLENQKEPLLGRGPKK